MTLLPMDDSLVRSSLRWARSHQCGQKNPEQGLEVGVGLLEPMGCLGGLLR